MAAVTSCENALKARKASVLFIISLKPSKTSSPSVYRYIILTNFRAYLISRIFGSLISRVLIFAIAKKSRKKAYKISRFCLCFYPEQSFALSSRFSSN